MGDCGGAMDLPWPVAHTQQQAGLQMVSECNVEGHQGCETTSGLSGCFHRARKCDLGNTEHATGCTDAFVGAGDSDCNRVQAAVLSPVPSA